MHESGSTADPIYDHEYSHAGETVRLGVQCNGIAREPRVCWQVGERRGERGHVRLDTPQPVVRLEEGETARLNGRLVSEIPVPHELGEGLNTAVEKLGTVVSESNRITADAAVFPEAIGGFECLGWESERSVMWYWRDERSDPRAYQIERGELVFRAQEWAEESCSRSELIEGYDLNLTFK